MTVVCVYLYQAYGSCPMMIKPHILKHYVYGVMIVALGTYMLYLYIEL